MTLRAEQHQVEAVAQDPSEETLIVPSTLAEQVATEPRQASPAHRSHAPVAAAVAITLAPVAQAVQAAAVPRDQQAQPTQAAVAAPMRPAVQA